ncbi:JmjC domain-containing protein [Shewanella woodyi]|uniref:ribosomal protein uL16 3-hydroxylase n=1 Tax=Shewanella woodyi TaxID=60961 RepID=UPI00374A22A0
MYKLNLNVAEFLTQYWQKKPLVIKGAFTNFIDPIGADELAGLACEEEISSRIVLTKERDWEIIQGPIEDYDQFGEKNWQLLVQAVNHWYPDTAPLIDAFRFIPDWRFDDLMVSFATQGGGVGPHIDNYDVFLLQGEGTRRWRVGAKGDYTPRGGDTNTALIDDFDPMIDVVLEAGDMLYIPPGYPHCAETLTTALSYSIGFRAPSQQELFSSIADHLLDTNTGLKRFTSSSEPKSASTVPFEHQQGMLSQINELFNQPEFYQTALGQLLSQNRFELDLSTPDTPYNLDDLNHALSEGAEVHRVGGLKVLQLEGDSNKLFINGEVFNCEQLKQSDITKLADTFALDNQQATALCQSSKIKELILALLNRGYYYLA